ncbi:uncharacterized protein LOC109095158 isoform X3 [Cyprinus carpio]|uniref:Uncharacterized protein LOC109095158 isoform X3 n=1 Tax=Cyprinus carpio TaxID=7962 RepID=A0A9Q9ZSN5_CYPCA|nr:uncharacterized protein LOC109095158 isoform X3 [Cyprinus carpio]
MTSDNRRREMFQIQQRNPIIPDSCHGKRRHERRSSCRKCSGDTRQHRWTHHTQERAAQIQAETDTHLQEQGPQTRTERVSTVPRVLFGDDIPGMEGLGTDITVVCPWEAFGDMELSDLAKYGII